MAGHESITALGRLIREVQAANKWSYADIAGNAHAAGRRLSKSRVESLRNDTLPSISVKAIEALAAGLSVPSDRVAAAAIESMGYALAGDAHTAESVVESDPTIGEPVRRVLLAALGAAHPSSAGSGRGGLAPVPDPLPGAAPDIVQASAADETTRDDKA